MTNPKHTDTSRSGDLVANMRDTIREWERDEPRDDWFLHQHDFAEAADRIEALEAENERLRKMLKPQWFYHGDDQSSDQCRFSPYEVIDEDFFGWGERKKEGPHLVHISTAMPGPDIWAVVRVLTDEEKDARDDDEPWLIEEYDTEEEARAALGEKQ